MVPLMKAKKYYRFIARDHRKEEDMEDDQQVQDFIIVHIETQLHSLVPEGSNAFTTWNLLCAKLEKVGPQLIANCLWSILVCGSVSAAYRCSAMAPAQTEPFCRPLISPTPWIAFPFLGVYP